MKKQVPILPVVAIGLAIVVAAAFSLLVKPKRDQAATLADEIANLETQLELALRPPPPVEPKGPEIEIADLFKLAKAMPDTSDMPGIILELNTVAEGAGVKFLAIQPQGATSGANYYGLPIQLTFSGSYYDLADFLFRLRNLVTVRDGELDAAGRLYTLDQMDLHEATDGFPQVEAVMTITAYTYGAVPTSTTLPQAPSAPAAQPGAAATAPASTEPAPSGETPAPAEAPEVPRVDGHGSNDSNGAALEGGEG